MQDASHSEAQRLLPNMSAPTTEAEPKKYGATEGHGIVEAIDDEAIIPKGALDPVYEAKARILNRAVSMILQLVRVS